MSLLDKKYVLTINLEDSSISSPKNMFFFNTDKNIANLYVKVQYRDEVIKYISETDAVNYNIKLTAIKPKTNTIREIEGIITNEFSEDYAIYKFELPSEFTDQVGPVVCEFVIINSNEILTINPFSYTINASKVTGLNPEVILNPDLPVLKQLIEDVKSAQQWISNIDDTNVSEVKTYSSKKIDEQFNTIQSQKANKEDVAKISNGTPLFVSSTTEMTDITRNYVNTTDGYLYIYSENAWVNSNVKYQETGLSNGQVTPTKTSFLTHGKNMINPDVITYGYYINDTGYKKEDASYCFTEKLYLVKNTDYYVSDFRYVTVYKNDGSVVSNEGKSIAGSGIINISEGDYIIITFQKSKIGVSAQLEIGSKGSSYVDYKYKFNKDLEIQDNYINGEMVNFLEKGKNLLDTNKSTKGYYIQSPTSSNLLQSSSYNTTEFIEVPKNTNISISPRARLICLYTEKNNSKGIISSYVSSTVNNHTINSGEGCYIRVSYFATDEDKMQIEISDSVTDYEPYGYNLVDVNTPKQDLSHLEVNTLIGKTLINFGDSIADGVSASYKSYAHRIAEKYNMTIHDYANGGATIKVTDGNTNNILNQINNAESVQVDYILFNGYTNDCYPVSNSTNESYLGTITTGYNDAYDTNTFCGAFEKIIKTLQEKYVGAKIVYVGTHINDSRDLKAQQIFNDLAIKICKKWGIIVANMFEEGGLNSLIATHKSLYINDGSHPNATGYEKYYMPLIESKMKSI